MLFSSGEYGLDLVICSTEIFDISLCIDNFLFDLRPSSSQQVFEVHWIKWFLISFEHSAIQDEHSTVFS